jgi:hypothetical protein
MNVNDQTFAAFAGANEERKKSLLQYVSEGANNADLEAAGYTPAEVAAAFSPIKSGATSKELDRDRQAAPKEVPMLQQAPTTSRDTLRENVRRGVSALGASDQTAQFYAGRVAGTGGDMGLIDVTGLGVIPGVQEGIQQAERGYKTGSKTDIAMGALNTGLNVLGAIPGGKVIAKGISKGTEKLAEKAMAAYDPAVLRTIGTPSDKTVEALGEVPKTVKSKGPKVVTPYLHGDNSVQKTINRKPDEKFGLQLLSQKVDVDPSVWDQKNMGGLINLTMDSLARVKVGKIDVPYLINHYGGDVTPETTAFVESHLARLDNNPAFVDYTNKLKEDINFDPWVESESKWGKTPDTSVSFRSPILEVVDQIEFPKKGIEGYQLLSELKNSPSVRKAEFETVTTAIDPKARYTKEEAKGLLEKDAWKVGSREYRNYEDTQRQVDVLDPEMDYFERAIVAEREGPTFDPTGSHFDQSSLAHSRASVREDVKGPYTLVEESQTDLLQHGFKEPSPAKAPESVVDTVEKNRADLLRTSNLGESGVDLLKLKALYDEFYHVETKNLPKEALKKRDEIVRDFVDHLPGEWNDSIKETIVKDATTGDDLWESLQKVKSGYADYFDIQPRDVSNTLEKNYRVMRGETNLQATPGVSQPPIKNIEESIKLVLDDLIAASIERGVTRIVMPPLDRIVSKRFPVGTEGYLKAMDPKSGFSKTYVSGFKKVLGDYQKKLGAEDFKVAPIDMNYSTEDNFANLSRVGTEIDFSGLVNKGYDLSKPHFAEGGDVGYAEGGTVEDEQMDRLMQDGGMADAGVAQEPVTGNEVPPGALPSEVRDDVPAQLSEGEYVVPADVLRFFGMRFFEDLRNQAKQGLAEMQSNGRIGGATVDSNGIPAPSEQEDQLSPEEEQMLNEALGKTGMAEGGVVPFDRTTFSLDQPTTLESRKYIDPKTGAIRNFAFSFGAPTELIPANFVPWTQALEDSAKNVTAPVVKPVTGGVSQPKKESWADTHPVTPPTGGTTGGTTDDPNKWATENYDAIKSDPFKYGMDALEDDTGKVAGQVLTGAAMIPAVSGPALLGAAAVKTYNAVENIANARTSMMVMESKGLKDSAEYKALEAATKAKIEKLPTIQQALVENNVVGSGKNKYANYVAEEEKRKGGTGGTTGGTAPVAPVKPEAPKNGGQGQTAPIKPPKNPARSDNGGGQSSNTTTPPTKAQVAQYTSSNATTPTKTTTPTKAQVAQYTSSKATTPTKTQAERTGNATGGLITKPQKTAPKTKGLAGKQ